MSDDRSPFTSLFRTQHQLIENGQQFVEQTMRVPLEMNEALRDSLDQQRRLQRETLELSHDAVIAMLDSANATTPGEQFDDVKTAVDEGFENLLDGHDQLYDGLDEGYGDAISGLEEAIEELTAQTEALIELNEEFEQHTTNAFEFSTGGVSETLTTQFGNLDEELEDPTEAEGRERVEKQREQIETVRERIESLQSELEKGVEKAQENAEQQGKEGETDETDASDAANVSDESDGVDVSEESDAADEPDETDET